MGEDSVQITREDVSAFSEKVQRWAKSLAPKEQAILAILLDDAQLIKRRELERDILTSGLIEKFKRQIQAVGGKGVVEYVVPQAGLAGKYCATVNLEEIK